VAPLFFKILGVEFLVIFSNFFSQKFKPIFLEIGDILTSEFFLRDKGVTPLLNGVIKIGDRSSGFFATGDQTPTVGHFFAFLVHFTRCCAKVVRSIPPCFGAKV